MPVIMKLNQKIKLLTVLDLIMKADDLNIWRQETEI